MLDKDDADVMSALTQWMESQGVKPRQAVIVMSGLCAVIMAKVAHSEQDLLDGIAACAKDMMVLGIEAHKLSRK